MISYPSEREQEARKIVSYCKELGISIWFDKESLVAGDDWSREIEFALSRAEVVIIVSSTETVIKSGVVQRELNRVIELSRDKPLGSNFIINIRSEAVILPPELARYQWIDMFDQDWKASLLRAINKKYEQIKRKPTRALEEAMLLLNAATDTQPRSILLQEGEISFSSSYFVYSEINDYWKYINAEIITAVYRSYYSARSAFLYYGRDRAMAWSLDIEEYYRAGDILSLKCSWFQDAGGGTPLSWYIHPKFRRRELRQTDT